MIGGNDSLNNFITKAGGQLSFGNRFRRSRQPGVGDERAKFHTGYYYGPQEGGQIPITKGGIMAERETSSGSVGGENGGEIDFSKSTYLNERDTNSQVGNLLSTPSENEDPVFYGFEVVINQMTSPLLNGEVIKFIENFGVSNEEISSRMDLAKSLREELSKYFRFEVDLTPNAYGDQTNIFGMRNRKRHYIKKIEGLDKLSERNEAKKSASFVNYKEDLLQISFYEDSTLSTGSLISLYKLLYWSRIRGKGVIPENLLRFDCQIIVSEVRNIARVREILNLEGDSGGETQEVNGNLEIIRENVSRYVYNVYECQFHFNKFTHPDSIDNESTPNPHENTSVGISYKFSDMRFEKFVFGGDFGKYEYLSNKKLNPRKPMSNDVGTSVDTEDGDIFVTQVQTEPIKVLKSNLKRSKIKEGSALNSLFRGVKRAALSEAQRRLNEEFRLLNNAIDKVRDSFGLGRMSAPTNVYQIPNNGSRFFFDVQNSLRNFVGDSLGNTIFGRGSQ